MRSTEMIRDVGRALPRLVAEPRSEPNPDVRTVIADARDGRLDDVPLTDELEKAARGQKKKGQRRHAKRFESFGELETVEFWETFDGADLYLLAFERARVVITLARTEPDGPFRSFRYRSIRIAEAAD